MTSVQNVNQYSGTSASWIEKNPILANGEVGFETDTNYVKIGDGSTSYVDLPAVKLVPAALETI
jgi:hypothetical protein